MKRFAHYASLLLGIVLVVATIWAGRNSLLAKGTETASAEPVPRVYLPFVSNFNDGFDMANFIVGDGRLYEVWHSSDNQARHQTQFEGERFYHTKGENSAEWEELWIDGNYVYRGTDTSPGSGLY